MPGDLSTYAHRARIAATRYPVASLATSSRTPGSSTNASRMPIGVDTPGANIPFTYSGSPGSSRHSFLASQKPAWIK